MFHPYIPDQPEDILSKVLGKVCVISAEINNAGFLSLGNKGDCQGDGKY
jgi:hypothetical protein